MIFFLVILTFVAFITVEYLMVRRKQRAEKMASLSKRWNILATATPPVYRSAPGLFYHSGHTWAYLDPSGEANVGMDDFAQGIVGKIERIEFPLPGARLRQGERAFTVVQKNKKVDFVSPLDGVVRTVNEAVTRDTDLIKRFPYTRGWLLTVEPTELISNLKRLKVGREALEWLEKEGKRFVEFLALHSARPQEVGVTMLDGGLYAEGVIENVDGELLHLLIKKFFR